jgi:hypothetical protein
MNATRHSGPGGCYRPLEGTTGESRSDGGGLDARSEDLAAQVAAHQVFIAGLPRVGANEAHSCILRVRII